MNQFKIIYDRIKVIKEKNKEASFLSLINVFITGAIRLMLAKIYLRKCTSIGKMVSINGKPIIENKGQIILDDNVRLWSNIVQSKLYTGSNGQLIVGNNSRLNGVHIDARELVKIGKNVRIAPYTIILDSDFHDIKDHFTDGPSKPVIIEDDVWLATRCTVLKGVTIGKGSVVAAGAVVTKDVPSNCVVAGVPASVIKRLP